METVPPDLFLAIKVATVLATVAIFVFVVQWTFTSPWWHDVVATTVVVKDFALLLILIPSTISILDPSLIPEICMAWIDVTSLGLVALVMFWRSVVWWRIRKPTLQHLRFLARRKADKSRQDCT